MEQQKIEKSKKPVMVVFISIVISIIVLLFGVTGMVMLARLKTPPVEAKNGERLLRVEALQVEQKDVPIFITGYGEVKVLKEVLIAPEVSGKIVAIHPRLETGEIIRKGDLLFKIDPKDYITVLKNSRKRLKILKRSHELAKKENQRVLLLFEKNNVVALSGLE